MRNKYIISGIILTTIYLMLTAMFILKCSAQVVQLDINGSSSHGAYSTSDDASTPDISTCDKVPLPQDLQIYLQNLCNSYSVPYTLALSVIETESAFIPGLVSCNCYGYMMIHSINLPWLRSQIGVTNLSDSKQNLHAGVYILSVHYEKYKDWHKALMCYSCGEGGAMRLFKKGYTTSYYSRYAMSEKAKWDSIVYHEEAA